MRGIASQRGLLERVVLAALAILLLVPSLAGAVPTNSTIEARKADAADARAKLDDLAADLEERAEEYAEIQAALDDTRQRIVQTEADLEEADAQLALVRQRLAERAAGMYRNGNLSVLSVLIGVTDFTDFLTRMDMYMRITQSDANLVDEVKSARDRVAKLGTALERRRTEQLALRARAGTKQAQVQRALRSQQAFLAGINKDIRRLIAEERERQRRIAEEKARRAAELAAAAAAAAGSVDVSSSVLATLRSGREFDPNALGPSHPEAVGFAMQFLGVPYVWGGTTPSGFDCSGLVQYAYMQAGILLPRTSRQQYRVGAYIPPDRLDLLEPGDLVFFGRNGDPSRVHHVAMFIGDGQMVHAPQTGDVVSVASLLDRIATRADYVGAVRP